MDTTSVMQLFSFSLPMVLSISAMLVMFVIYGQTRKRAQTDHLILLIVYFALLTIDQITAGMGRKSPELFTHLNGLLFTVALVQPIIYANFVFIITRTDGKERFSIWNYALPILFLVVWLVWSPLVPYEARLLITKRMGSGGYEYYKIFFSYRIYVLYLVYAGYIIWQAFRIFRYLKNIRNVPYPSERKLPSLKWLIVMLVLDLVTVATNFYMIFGASEDMALAMMGIGNVIYIVWLMIVCYNMMVGNYWLVPKIARTGNDAVSPANDRMEEAVPRNTTPSLNVNIDRERFESYIRKEKPYLNPEFKIADLAQGIGSNRTYVSMFIKATFGTNFNGYLNTLRLEEFDRITASGSMANATKADIAAEAGFGTYKSYMRARAQLTDRQGPESV